MTRHLIHAAGQKWDGFTWAIHCLNKACLLTVHENKINETLRSLLMSQGKGGKLQNLLKNSSQVIYSIYPYISALTEYKV